MTYEEIMQQLEALGTEQTKQTFIRHGAQEPLFGVKIGDLKKLVKYIKKQPDLVMKLYQSGNSDAMYLAGLAVNPKLLSKEQLQQWADQASWYLLTETTVAGVAAESAYALELAREWIQSDQEKLAACGWATYANYISITEDSLLDITEIASLLHRIETSIHQQPNRVRYTMNGFVIMVGGSVVSLYEEVCRTAEIIGKVHVDVGRTACKVPLASAYIHKIEEAGKRGIKKKTCIC